MILDRRSFIKFATGAIVGIPASPLIPKLIDDSAIWTQNWSWVPISEGNELAFANTVNPVTGTGIRAHLVKARIPGQRVIRIEGNSEHPLTLGGVLPADVSAVQFLYNDENRVSSPLQYDKKTGMFHEISWESALILLTNKLTELVQADSSYKLIALGGEPNSIHSQILSHFMASYGSPNLVFYPRADDTLALASWALTGQEDIGFDLANASYILSFGTPLLEEFGSPVAIRKAFIEWKKNNAILVQVEPRCSITASQANFFLPCNPGTESIVALGICTVMLENDLIDSSIISAYGFSKFRSILARDYNLAKVVEISGISAEVIKTIARNFAKNNKAIAVCGPGPGGNPGKLTDFIAVLVLNALKGNFGKPGGIVARNSLGIKKIVKPFFVERPSLVTNKSWGGGGKYINYLAMIKAALSGSPYTANIALVAEGNPVYSGPHPKLISELLQAIPFVVVITPFLNETAMLADLVLPSSTFLESWTDCYSPYGSPISVYGLARPLVRPYPQAKTVGDIILALAAKLGNMLDPVLSYNSVENVLKNQLAPVGGLDYLVKKSYIIQEKPMYGPFNFKTLSGNFEFESRNLAVLTGKVENVAFLPYWNNSQSALGQYNIKKDTLIMAPVPSLRSTVNFHLVAPYMLKMQDNNILRYKNELVVEINPETATALDLIEDSKIMLTSSLGSIQARVHLYAGAAPGMIFMPVGLGHTALDDAYTYYRGENFYRVAEITTDSLSGLLSWGLTRVVVNKIREK